MSGAMNPRLLKIHSAACPDVIYFEKEETMQLVYIKFLSEADRVTLKCGK